MSLIKKEFRLRVRNAADTADDFIISSKVGDSNLYLESPPHGDGQKVNVITGNVDVGAYQVPVIDTGTAPVNVVTSKLYDAGKRITLLNRRAYNEIATNGGSWLMLSAGYISAIRLVDPGLFIFTIGDTRRTEQTFELFRSIIKTNRDGTETTLRLNRATSFIGGPVEGGFAATRDHGGWRFRVEEKYGGINIVRLRFEQGWYPTNQGYKQVSGWSNMPVAEGVRLTTAFKPYQVNDGKYWNQLQVRYAYPRIRAKIFNEVGALLATVPVWGSRGSESSILGRGDLLVDWAGAPALTTKVWVYLYPVDISAFNPLHLNGHPADIVGDMWADSGIPYDPASIVAARSAIGPDIRVGLRFNAPQKLVDVERSLFGLFGLGTRIDSSGRRVMFSTRVKASASPSLSYTYSDLREDIPELFNTSEAQIINRVIIKQQGFQEWSNPGDGGFFRLIDGDYFNHMDFVMEVPQTAEIEYEDPASYGVKDVVYELNGYIYSASAQSGLGYLPSGTQLPIDLYACGIAGEIFDRFGRGPVEIPLKFSDTFTAQLGEEFILTAAHYPNSNNTRGGTRTFQVVQRTETVDGPDIVALDSGENVQASITPTFTLAANAAQPRNVVDITLTNVSALVAAGLLVRYQFAVSATTPTDDGTLLTTADPAVYTAVSSPMLDGGSKVYVKARSELLGRRPSAWSAWQNITLTAIPALSGLTATPVGPTEYDLAWTNPDSGPLNMVVGARMDTDSNADGIVDGFSLLTSGGVVGGVLSLDATKKAQKIVLPTGNAAKFHGVLIELGGIVPGKRYSYSVQAEGSYTVAGRAQIYMEFRDASHVFIAGTNVSMNATPTTPTRLTLINQLAPAGAAYAQIQAYAFAPGAADAATVYFNNIMFEEGTVATPSFIDESFLRGQYLVDILLRAATSETLARIVETLPPGSTKYRLNVRDSATNYEFGPRLRERPPLNGVSAQLTTSPTTGTKTALTAPTNARAFSGIQNAPDPALARVQNDGIFGMDVDATVIPSATEFYLATETAIGSNTPGAFVLATSVISKAADKTFFLTTAPNDGLRRYMYARHVVDHRDASPATSIVNVFPWVATAAVDEGIPSPSALTVAAVYSVSDRGEEARLRVSFTRPTQAHFARMIYSVQSRPLGSVAEYGGSTFVVGSLNGPDLIPAQFSTDYLVTPYTETSGTRTRTIGTAVQVNVAARTDPTPTFGTPIATSSYIEYPNITYDTETKYIVVWSKLFTSSPDASSMENAIGATLVTTLNKGDGRSLIQLSVDATNIWRKTTFVPYDKDGNRGPVTTLSTQRATPATPAAPASATNTSNPNPSTGSITNRVTLGAGAVAGWSIRTYRGGVSYGSDRSLVAGDITAGFVDIVDSGALVSTTYSYEYSTINATGIESTTKTTPLNVTTFSGGTVPTPTGVTVDYDLGYHTISWTPGGGTPPGASYTVQKRSPSGSGSYVFASSTTSLSTVHPAQTCPTTRGYRVIAKKVGWTDSSPTSEVTGQCDNGSR